MLSKTLFLVFLKPPPLFFWHVCLFLNVVVPIPSRALVRVDLLLALFVLAFSSSLTEFRYASVSLVLSPKGKDDRLDWMPKHFKGLKTEKVDEESA
jgi:hypothetical protein